MKTHMKKIKLRSYSVLSYYWDVPLSQGSLHLAHLRVRISRLFAGIAFLQFVSFLVIRGATNFSKYSNWWGDIRMYWKNLWGSLRWKSFLTKTNSDWVSLSFSMNIGSTQNSLQKQVTNKFKLLATWSNKTMINVINNLFANC